MLVSTTPMKVLHLISRYRWTGCAEPAVNLCRFLAEEGADSRLCCVPGGSLDRRARELGARVVDAARLGRDYTPWGILSSARALSRYVRREGIEILHAHTSHDHWLAALAMRLAADAAVPIVRTHHETRKVRTGILWRRIFNGSTAANIAVSTASREFFVNRGAIQPDRIRTIHGGLDFSLLRTSTPPSAVRAAWRLPHDAKVIAHLSHIGPDRRQETTLEAFPLVSDEFPKAHLVFLGQGNRSTVRRLRRLVATRPFAERVRFSRDYTQRSIPWPDQVAAADVVVVLAVGSEGSSRGVMEAMALARPVVGGRVGVIPELIEDGKSGWIADPSDPVRIAGALRDALGDPEGAARRGTAGSGVVRARFRCERQAREVVDLYREILGLGTRARPAAGWK